LTPRYGALETALTGNGAAHHGLRHGTVPLASDDMIAAVTVS
jgi:hypothetical protein